MAGDWDHFEPGFDQAELLTTGSVRYFCQAVAISPVLEAPPGRVAEEPLTQTSLGSSPTTSFTLSCAAAKRLT